MPPSAGENGGSTGGAAVRATAGESPSPRIVFHHWYFVTRPKDESTAPGSGWFTLSSQKLTDTRRYYLYGFTGNRRKLLRFYGGKAPQFEDVKSTIEELIRNGLAGPEQPGR